MKQLNNKTIKILSSFETPQKERLMGNEAIARGAIEAGVRGVFAYPGTPSTEISEEFKHIGEFQNDPDAIKQYPELCANQIYFEYSINEKVAVEKAIAYSLGNRKAMCCMKSAGLNVASDPLMTIVYQTIGTALVIVVCDDPGCFSSSTEQDSRYWGKMASVPVFNPATAEDALNMTKDAFALSELLKLPVIVRSTTRVSHSRGIVRVGKISYADQTPEFTKSPQHINIPAKTGAAHKNLLDKLDDELINSFHQMNNVVFDTPDAPNGDAVNRGGLTAGSDTGCQGADPDSNTSENAVNRGGLTAREVPLGIITSGVAAAYTLEIINTNQISDRICLLKLGLIHPFPERDVLKFLKRGFDKVLILEELDPIIENEVRLLAQKNNLNVEIYGKNYAGLSVVGEYGLGIVNRAIEEFTGLKFERQTSLPLEDIKRFMKDLPPRPPALCPGCAHRATFYALKLAVPRADSKIVLCGDIGCFGLGAMPPFQMIDTIHHMGMSISMAQGLAEAISPNRCQSTVVDSNSTDDAVNHGGLTAGSESGGLTAGNKTIALVGDGTFFHSGVASLLNAVYTKANITVIIFDNRTIGMTGHQCYPGAISHDRTAQVDLSDLLKGMGIQFVESVDPNDIIKTFHLVKDAMAFTGVSVVIAKSPCVFLPEFKDIVHNRRKIVVDPNLCNTCHNQEDSTIHCSKGFSAENSLTKARAKIIAKDHIPASEQLCPANICNHGFFNAILTGDYKESLNIVRDKMLFARVCGDICPKPCEIIFRSEDQAVVPIKKLKQFVAGIEENFDDFSIQKKLTASAEKKNKNVAIVGAGPAGLSAAYDLIQAGYGVTVFEKEKEAGGLLKFAIPAFRMDKKGYDTEISALDELGVEFKFNTSLGKNIQLKKLADDFDAVIVAIGMGISTTLDVVEKNVPTSNKFDALTFLQQYNQKTLEIEKASTIFVLGGGNSAIDAARAAREYGVENVTIVYRRSREEMPAFDEEIEEAITEGVKIINHVVIDTCTVDSAGKINVKLKSFKGDKDFGELQGDYIVSAIGQSGDEKDFASAALETDNAKRIIADPDSGRTEFKNVFAAGDISAGNHISVIGAIASGKKATIGVRQLLEGYTFAYEGQKALDLLNVQGRTGLKSPKVETGKFVESYIKAEMSKFDLYQACGKCDHCIENFGCPALIKVDGKVVIDDNQCNQCGLCIDVCINNAIHWV
ncbi:MAG: FAD-dependent oxidoreductase [Candidatus Hatepunaea meridiana]|nr:FAD-dependent oxidoreductase [Candidatus Hatepunaea meridiana]